MKRKVYVIGTGIGGTQGLTREAAEILARCDCVFGEKDLLAVLSPVCPKVEQTKPEKIREYLEDRQDIREAAVLFIGDAGFGAEAEEMRSVLQNFCTITTVAGVGAIPYFCAQIGCSWQNAQLLAGNTSLEEMIGAVRTNERTFLQTGRYGTAQDVCGQLCSVGLGALQVTVGEALGTARERILTDCAAELSLQKFSPQCVLLIQNPKPVRAQVRTCIPDNEFFHTGIPITRSEVRAVSVGKLCLQPDSIVYDIGCGTGSVSVECALQAPKGMVYAIDKNRSALHLTAENREKFKAYNIKPVEGEAPNVLRGLPQPDCVFIGGSTGNLPEILREILQKNPCVRIVLNAISLETVVQAVQCVEHFRLTDVDIAQVSVAKSHPSGGHKLMQAQNPVYVISGYGPYEGSD
jgi:precorrin-6Y C5,15-methyltransferase (decarboxylating)